MKSQSACALLVISLSVFSCAGDTTKEDPQPTNPIPENTVSLKIDGVPISVDLSRTVVNVYSSSSNLLTAAIFTTDFPTQQVVRLVLEE